MTAIEDARAALAKYYTVSTQGYGAGEHQNLAAALGALLDERLTAPPTDDEREALRREFEYRIRAAVAYGCGKGYRDRPSQERADWIQHEIDGAMSSRGVAGFRRQGPITDAQVERVAKAAWVAHQDDHEWATCVVDDVFSPADDWPEEALAMAAVARAAIEAARDA